MIILCYVNEVQMFLKKYFFNYIFLVLISLLLIINKMMFTTSECPKPEVLNKCNVQTNVIKMWCNENIKFETYFGLLSQTNCRRKKKHLRNLFWKYSDTEIEEIHSMT